jgi:hypothetical protein
MPGGVRGVRKAIFTKAGEGSNLFFKQNAYDSINFMLV